MNDDTQKMITDATTTALNFAAAWTEWELAMAKDEENSMEDPIMQQARRDIVSTYCTTKKRAYVDASMSYSEPPTYRHVIEKNITSSELISNTRVEIVAKGQNIIHKFVVLRKGNCWLLDSIKWAGQEGGEWNNGLIGSP